MATRSRIRRLILIAGTWLSVLYAAAFAAYAWLWQREGLPPGQIIGITYPLIYRFLAVAIPTLLVWWFWPKPLKPGHCRCGYDLTGNTSGVCPECGIEVQA